MVSTRDQVEAYTFANRRQVLALLRGEDAGNEDPRRRLNRSLMAGLLVAVLALAATGVAGFLTGNGASATLPSSGVIVDASTGGPYVIVDNVLHPALNITSAKLLAGNTVTKVESSALASVKHGLPVGIPGAPDALPPASRLTAAPWTVCSVAPEASDARPEVVVSIGARTPSPLPSSSAVVARTPDGTTWLIDDGERYHVDSRVSTLLGLTQVDPIPLQPQVLDVVPAGPDLAVPKVDGSGAAPHADLPFDASVGDLIRSSTGPERYVVLADGIAPVDAFAYALLAGNAGKVLTEPSRALASVPAVERPAVVPAGWPHTAVSHLVAPPSAGSPLCMTYSPAARHTGAAWPVTVSEPSSVPFATGARPVSATSGTLPTVASGIAVPSGAGVLARATSTGGVDGVYTLVTDSGLRFSVADSSAVGRLGYATGTATAVPLPLVSLLPAGPALDPTTAGTEYAGAATAPPVTSTATPSSSPTP